MTTDTSTLPRRALVERDDSATPTHRESPLGTSGGLLQFWRGDAASLRGERPSGGFRSPLIGRALGTLNLLKGVPFNGSGQ